MIDFIYVAIILVYLFLVLAFYTKEFILGLLASMGLMVTGIYMLINGVGDISNFLTEAFGIINIAIGAYIFINGSLQAFEKF